MDYSRQLKLDFISAQGQQALANSRVIVFGAGGLGCTALAYLAAAGIGHISIVDADTIAAHNLHRQILYSPPDIGNYKAQTSAAFIQALNPHCSVRAISQLLTGADLITQLQDHDLVLDCTDDQQFSLHLNQLACVYQIPVVFANASRMQGQLFVYNGSAEDACLCCLWGDIAPANNASCDGLGVLGPVPGILGNLQAIEAIKFLVNHSAAPVLSNTLLNYDFLSHQFQKLSLVKAANCLHHNSTQAEISMPASNIYRDDLAQASTQEFIVIDICNPDERAQALAVEHQQYSVEQLSQDHEQLLKHDQKYLLVCKTGKRSLALQQHLYAQGYTNISAYVPS